MPTMLNALMARPVRPVAGAGPPLNAHEVGEVAAATVSPGTTPASARGTVLDAATVRVSVAVPVPAAFVAPIVIGVVAATVGVPLMTPVTVLIDSPVGSPVALNEVGL